MKKIVYSSNKSWSIYNYRLTLLKKLQSSGYIIHVVAPKDTYTDLLISENFIFHEIKLNNNSKRLFDVVFLPFKYYLIYKKINPDFICHNAIKPNIFGTIAASFLDTIVINNISGLGSSFLGSRLVKTVTILLYMVSQKFANKVLFQNTHDSDYFTKLKILPQHKSFLIPGSGVDINKFSYSERTNKKIFKFIFIGRLIADKGILELCDAINQLQKSHKDFILKIVGEPHFENPSSLNNKQLLKLRHNPFVKLYGHRDNVVDFLKESDCLVLPSYREGLSKVLLEAGSTGLPSITTNVPGCKDVIINDFNGLIVEPKDSQSLYNGMKKIMEMDKSKLKNLGLNARKQVEKKFSSSSVDRIYIDFILNS